MSARRSGPYSRKSVPPNFLTTKGTERLRASRQNSGPRAWIAVVATCSNYDLAPVEIIPACTALIELQGISDANLVDVLFKRGSAYRRQANYQSATSDVDWALRVQPNHAYSWATRAYVYENTGDKNTAEEIFLKAIALNPDPNWERTWLFASRANLFYLRGNYTRSLQDYDRALKYQPEYYRAFMRTVFIHIEQKEYDLAIDLLNQAATIWPDEKRVFELLGQLHYHYSEDFGQVLVAFSRFAEIETVDEIALYYLGLTHLKFGAEDVGKNYIERFAAHADKTKFAGRGMIRDAIIHLLDKVLLGESSQFVFRGMAYGSARRPELARIEFDRSLQEGGVHAQKIIQDFVIEHDLYSDIRSEQNIDNSIDRLIKYCEGLFAIEHIRKRRHE